MNIVFAGTPDFAVPPLRTLLASEHRLCAVYTQPDRPAGRGRKLRPSPVKVLASEAGIPVCQPESLSTEENFQQLAAFAADLIVVVAYGLILPQKVLDLPRYGCINIHASLLPRWRGAAPIQRALMAGDRKTGVTLMQMVRKLDAGAMLHKEECVIASDDTAASLHDKLAELGSAGLVKVLAKLEAGELTPEAQDEALVTYAEKLEKSEAEIDWREPAEQLARQVRGLNAWPVAQTRYRGETLRIWQAEAVDRVSDAEPGTVFSRDKYWDVATGKGFLRLREVQLPGGKRLSAEAFLNAHDVDGLRLG